MFKRRGVAQSYASKLTLYWLKWLAQKMLQSSLSVFSIEIMQRSWISNPILKFLYVIFDELFYSAIFSLSMFSFFGRIYGIRIGLLIAVPIGIINLFGMVFWVKQEDDIRLTEKLKVNAIILSDRIFSGGCITVMATFSLFVLGVLIFVCLRWVLALNEFSLVKWWIFGLAFGSFFGIVYFFDYLFRPENYSVIVDSKNKPNQGIWLTFYNARFGLLFGSLLGFFLISGNLTLMRVLFRLTEVA